MKTIAINTLVIAWVSLLFFAPALLSASYRRPSALTFAVGGGASLALISFVTFATGRLGIGSIAPLRICAVALGLVLLWAILRIGYQLKRGMRFGDFGPDWVSVPLGLALGVWVLVPPLRALSRQGVTFGLASLGNPDIANYTLAAENTGSSGFDNSYHLANLDLGSWSQHESYIGATALINFVSAATGLSAFQATLATMGVAVCFLAVALWALGRSIWPSAPYAVGAAVVVACLGGLSTYTIAQFFLAGALGLASTAIALAGATVLAREPSRPAMLAIAVGGACGIYCYGHLGLPFVFLLPFWTAFAALISGVRNPRQLLAVAIRSSIGVVGAFVIASIALSEAFRLVVLQSNAEAGFPLPVMTSVSALFWPSGIGFDSTHAEIIVSWTAALLLIAIALAGAWWRGLKSPVRLAIALGIMSLALVGLFNILYGTTRYQSWKMEAFLLPLVIVAALPAIGASARGSSRIGRPILGACMGAVVLCPVLVWSSSLHPVNPGKITTSSLVALGKSPALANVASVNIRVPSPLQTMGAGAIITGSTVIFTKDSYYAQLTSLSTCTLTVIDLLSPGETDFVPLGGRFVLLNKPSPCALKK